VEQTNRQTYTQKHIHAHNVFIEGKKKGRRRNEKEEEKKKEGKHGLEKEEEGKEEMT
jgi:hypothetical protein